MELLLAVLPLLFVITFLAILQTFLLLLFIAAPMVVAVVMAVAVSLSELCSLSLVEWYSEQPFADHLTSPSCGIPDSSQDQHHNHQHRYHSSEPTLWPLPVALRAAASCASCSVFERARRALQSCLVASVQTRVPLLLQLRRLDRLQRCSLVLAAGARSLSPLPI